MNALIGYSGFVGSTLSKQAAFDARFRSTNIHEIDGRSFDTVVCAAAPAQKWIANRDPAADRKTIDGLIERLSTIQCRRFILLSTVDVFKHPIGVTEESAVDEDGLHAYGLHRRLLEKFATSRFEDSLIVRLPGLVGPGLRKNVIYDFQHDNNLHAIDSRGSFQFYPMINLWYDIETALAHGIRLLHLTAEPITVAQVSALGFGKPFTQELVAAPASYDMQSIHAAAFGGQGRYQYSARDTVQAVRGYAQSEPKREPAAGNAA